VQAVDTANAALVAAVKGGAAGWEAALAPAQPPGSPSARRAQPLASPTARLLQPPRSPAAAALAAAGAPPELRAAQEAMRAAVAMCVRFSQDHFSHVSAPPGPPRGGSGASPAAHAAAGADAAEEAETDPVRRVWLEVLQRYVAAVRQLRNEERRAAAAAAAGGGAGGAEARLELLEAAFTGLLEEVIARMAGHVPMRAIAEAVLRRYGGDPFGDFRGTLLGLLGACNFELDTLHCASRVTGADAITLLTAGYRRCMRAAVPGAPPAAAEEGEGAANGGLDGGASDGEADATNGAAIMDVSARLAGMQSLGSDALSRAAAAAAPAAEKMLKRVTLGANGA
jgi:hypothetical protein